MKTDICAVCKNGPFCDSKRSFLGDLSFLAHFSTNATNFPLTFFFYLCHFKLTSLHLGVACENQGRFYFGGKCFFVPKTKSSSFAKANHLCNSTQQESEVASITSAELYDNLKPIFVCSNTYKGL